MPSGRRQRRLNSKNDCATMMKHGGKNRQKSLSPDRKQKSPGFFRGLDNLAIISWRIRDSNP